MSYTGFIARRYLRSRQHHGFLSFITVIAILGVMLGTASLIIALAVLGGFEREITEKVIGFTSHVQVQGYQNAVLPGFERSLRILRDSIPTVEAAAPFVAREALIRSASSVDGILLKGITPDRDVTAAGRYLVEGSLDVSRQAGDMPRLLIGRKLARKLDLKVGDSAVVFGMGQALDPATMRARKFHVCGLYESGMAEYDDVYAYTTLEDAQILFQTGDAVTGYDILLTHADSASTARAAERAEALLGYPHYGRTVFQNYRNLFQWISLQKEPVPIILGLIIAVATVNIVGTLLMMVLEKAREIGILRSMGATRWGVTRIFLREGMTIGLVGTVAGNLLAWLVCAAQLEWRILSLPSDIYFMSAVPVLLVPEHFLIVSAVSMALCLASSFVPALLAARLDPVQAIRLR
ncbi:MAG: ABC transporter permease [Bacteroidota bacterium]